MADIMPRGTYGLLSNTSKIASSNAALGGAGGVSWDQFTTKSNPAPVDPHAGKIFREGRWWTPEEYHNYYYKLGPYAEQETPNGGTSLQQAVSNLASAQTFPTFNLSVPNLSWNPNEQQKTDWLAEAVKRANLQIDPQVQAANQGYERFNTLAQNQIAEVNPQYDALSNAIANVFKNTVNQNLVNQAIRRGATESGWLPEELAKAGREEVSQRKGILNERDQILESIRNQVLSKRQETDDALAMLEQMRGAQTDVSYADLERLARSDFLEEKQNTFQNQLNNAQFQSGYSMDKANYLLNQFATQKNAQLQEAELALNERKTALDEAMANYQMAQANAKSYTPAEKTYTVRIGNYDVPLNTAQYISYMSDLNNKSSNKTLAEYLFGE